MMWSRRGLLWSAGAIAAGTALSGIGWMRRWQFSAKHYPPTPYDDIFTHLPDRDAAARMGQYVLGSMPNLEPSAAANVVRARLTQQSLAETISADTQAGRLLEVNGWVIPETLALLGALAASI